MNVLGVELRRSSAFGAALLVLAVGVGTLYVAPGRWSSGWLSLSLSMREYMLLLWPVALAAGAWQGRREDRAGVADLFAATPRSRARRTLPVLVALGGAVAAAYVLIAVAGGASFLASPSYLSPSFFSITAGGALSLTGAAWLGLGLGRLLPAAVTAPALAVLGVVIVLFSSFARPHWLAAVLSPAYGSLQFYPYQTIDGRVTAAFSIWMAGLGLTGALLATADRRSLFAAAVLPALLGLGLAVVVVPRDEVVTEAPIDAAAATLVCTDDTPTVCVTRVNAGVLDELTGPAREGLAVLARLPGAPAELHEKITPYDFWTDRPPPTETGVALIPLVVDRHRHLANPAAVVPLVVGTLGVTRYAPCDNRHGSVERAAAYYLLGREPVSDVGIEPDLTGEGPGLNQEAVRLWQGLRKLPVDEALARVLAVRQAIVDCRDSSELLPGSPR